MLVMSARCPMQVLGRVVGEESDKRRRTLSQRNAGGSAWQKMGFRTNVHVRVPLAPPNCPRSKRDGVREPAKPNGGDKQKRARDLGEGARAARSAASHGTTRELW